MRFPLRIRHLMRLISAPIMLIVSLIPATGLFSAAQNLTLRDLVTPSTAVMKDGKPVTFALYGFIEFKSLSEAFPYIDTQSKRWPPESLMAEEVRRGIALDLLRRAVESRVVSMADERPLEVLLTHTEDELKQALAQVKDPVPPGYADAFLEAKRKWDHSLNCWSASPVMAARVLSNWYPIEEGINLYGATYDSTEHFWQAVKYHPDVTVGQLYDLLQIFQKKDWSKWLADLEGDPTVYFQNAYSIEFLRHNLAPERLQWFGDELARQGLPADEHPRQVQQRSTHSPHFTAYEEKVLWGDLADLFHLVYHFSAPQDAVRDELVRRHFDGIYLNGKKLEFISGEFQSQMLEIWKVKYLEMPRFREVIRSIPRQVRLEHFLNDGDSPDIPISEYVRYLNQIRELAKKPDPVETQPTSSGTTSAPTQKKFLPTGP